MTEEGKCVPESAVCKTDRTKKNVEKGRTAAGELEKNRERGLGYSCQGFGQKWFLQANV